MTDDDFENINRFTSVLIQNLGLDVGDFSNGQIVDPTHFKGTVSSAAHHLGTARMAKTEEKGVVNSDLKVFGYDNLYICDASVFPSGGNANPSLTISALAFHAMDKIEL